MSGQTTSVAAVAAAGQIQADRPHGAWRGGGWRTRAGGIALGMLLVLFGAQTAQAATYSWTGASSSNWSDSGNWTPTGVPTNGDSIAFPAGVAPAHLSTNNDLHAGTSFKALAINGDGYTLAGNNIALTAALSSSGDNNVVNIAIDVGANAITIDGGGNLTLNGALSGSGPITLTGSATDITYLTLNGSHPDYSGTFTTTNTGHGAYLILNGASLPSAVANGYVVLGNGTIGTLNSTQFLSPGPGTYSPCCGSDGAGKLNTGSLTLSGGNIYFDINGSTTAGTDYDQISVTGTVALGTSTRLNLSMNPSFVPKINDVFTLVANDGSDAVAGTFYNMPEGTIIKLNGAELQLSYKGGDGNDVTLRCTYEPKVWNGNGSDNEWSTAGNWRGGVAPVGGEGLAFPAGASRTANDNNIAANTSFKGLALNGDGYTITGNGVVLAERLSSAGMTNVVSLPISVSTNAVTIDGGGSLTLNGALTGSGPITLTGTNGNSTHLTVAGSHTYSGNLTSTFTNGGSYLVLDGASLAANVEIGSNTYLSGNGSTTGALKVDSNGHQDPGANDSTCCGNGSSGKLTAQNLTLDSADLYFDINGATAGSGYDQISVTGGMVALGTTSQLNVTMGPSFVPAASDVYTLIAGSAVTGTFYGMPEGTILNLNGTQLQLSYAGGNVTLTVISASVPKVWTGMTSGQWSDHTNWQGGVAPTNGDTLVFPAGASNLSPKNDLSGLSLKGLVLTGSNYQITGSNSTVLTDTLKVTGDNNVVSLPIDVQANAITIKGGGSVALNGTLNGSGPITSTEFTLLTLGATGNYSGTLTSDCHLTTSPPCGYLLLKGASLPSASVANGYKLLGNGTIGALTSTQYLSPGPETTPNRNCCGNDGSATLNTKNLTLNGGNIYFDINGATAGSGYDQISVTGTVALGTTTQLNVSMSLSFVPAVTDVYTLIANDSTDAVTGTFKGMPEGTILNVNGAYQLALSYVGGTSGNDVTLRPVNGKGNQTITFTSTAPGGAVVGTTYTVTATGGGSGNAVTFTIDGAPSSACSISGSTISFTGNGTCTIDANQAGSDAYNAAPQAQQSVSIGKGNQTINFTSTAPSGALVGGATYTPTATATSGLAVTISIDGSATGICSIAGGVVSFNAAGTCVIDATQAGDSNWNAATQKQQSIVVSKNGQTISFTSTAPSNAVVGGPSYTPSPLATSGLTVALTVDGSASSVCSISGSVVSFNAPGTCVIDANQMGNGTYSPAPQNQQSFAVGKGSQAITFTSTTPSAATVGGANYLVTASGGPSVNAVTFMIDGSATSICMISGATVTFQAAGTCVIDANQQGDGNYNAAPQVQQSFAVGPPTANIQVNAPARAMPSPTMADALTYTVVFTAPITGLSASNFTVATTGGITSASVGAISTSDGGTTWTVTVNNSGHGTGTLQLTVDNPTGIGGAGNHTLGGTPVHGEIYSLDKGGTVLSALGQGQLDAGFGAGGYALFNLTQGVASPGAIAVLTSGKILVAGGIQCNAGTGTSCTLQLMQYLANGTPDTTFAPGGRVITGVTGINADLAGLIANSDGTFFVAGSRVSGGNTIPFVAKFTANGAPVSTYGTGGLANLSSLLLGSALTGAAVDSSGRVVIAGTTPSGGTLVGKDVLVARLTTLGGLDATFGTSGAMSYGLSTTSTWDDVAGDVVVQPNGFIVVGGRTIGTSGFNDFMLLRFTATGAWDNSFGTLGAATARFAGSTDNNGRKLVLQPDGKLVLIGGVQVSAGMQCGVVRFNGNGTPDASFGTSGQVLIPLSQGCLGVTLQSDGKLVVTAQDRNADVTYATYARMLPNGAPDPTFGSSGVQDISSYTGATEVAVAAGGKLVSGAVIADTDGIHKSYVVQLTSQLSPVTTSTITLISPSPALTGQLYTVSVTVAAPSGTPSGQVTVSDGTGATCSFMLGGTGSGSCPLASTTPGTKTVTASYAGTPSFQPSSGTKSQTVNVATTATALSASATTVLVGTTVTFTATVTATSAGATQPTGTVTFYNGNASLGTATIGAGGAAALPLSNLVAGNYNITATYNGDNVYFKPSTSSKVTVQVQALPIVQFSANSVNVADTAGTLTLTVKRSGSTLGAVSVHYATADGTAKAGTDYSATAGTLTWPVGDGTSRTFTVPILATAGNQSNRTFTVTLSLPSGATLGTPSTETVTVQK